MVLFVAVFILEGWMESRYSRMIDQQEQNESPSSSSTSISPALSLNFTVEPSNVKETAETISQEHSIIPKQAENQSRSNGAVEPLWQRLGFQSCRMPEFYDPSRQKYDLTLSSTFTNDIINDNAWIIDAGWQRREELKDRVLASASTEPIEDHTNEYYQMMIRKGQSHYQNNNSDGSNFSWKDLVISRNISFVHIGKAGGSSLGCHLAEARRYVHKHCAPEIMRRPTPLSALSLHVNCYTHWQGHMYCYDSDNVHHESGNDAATTAVPDGTEKNMENDVKKSGIRNSKGHPHPKKSYLVNIRNPIDRMASWFLYEHILNHQVNYAERGYHCGDLMLFSCFEAWDDLVTRGLRPIKSRNKNNQLKIGGNLTQEECSQWAWAAVQGAIPASYHNFYNYDWYAHHMMMKDDLLKDGTVRDGDYTENSNKRRSDDKQLFVTRAEHLQDDWIVINQMLSGNGESNNFDKNSSSFDVPPVSLRERQNAAQRKDLPIFNKTASRDGMSNVCLALCREIQIYKALIWRAVNLQAKDWEVSLRELQVVCPNEKSLQPRSCPSQQ